MSCSCSTSEDFVVINSSCQIGSNSFLLVESNPVCVHVSMCMRAAQCVQLFATPLTVAYQAPLSMGSFRQGYWRGLPFPPPEDLPNSETEPMSPAFSASQVASLATEPLGNWCSINTSNINDRSQIL